MEFRHNIAFARENRFAGWPANNGLWAWEGAEILVGCSTGAFIVQPGHNVGDHIESILLRSLDGGETWTAEHPEHFVGSGSAPCAPDQALDFTHPGCILRMTGAGYHGNDEKRGGFFASTDRGKHWGGPFFFVGLERAKQLHGMELTPRTDYLINGPQDCLALLSARNPARWGSDRVFCARTTDGGLHWQFIGWVVPPADPYRAVMPSTVRCGSLKLVSAVRRRNLGTGKCWIDAFLSEDGGLGWRFLSQVGETGSENGNPPALARLSDGRLCCVYGCRTRRQMMARFSADDGATWEPEIVLRDQFSALDDEADFGYPRLAQRADGKLVAVYYWAAKQVPQQHIAVTIF